MSTTCAPVAATRSAGARWTFTPLAPPPIATTSSPSIEASTITGHGRRAPKGVMAPRTYPVSAFASSSVGSVSRLAPSSALSFGQLKRRPPGTRTNRKSSADRRTRMDRSSEPSGTPWSRALSSALRAISVRTTRNGTPAASRAAMAGVAVGAEVAGGSGAPGRSGITGWSVIGEG